MLARRLKCSAYCRANRMQAMWQLLQELFQSALHKYIKSFMTLNEHIAKYIVENSIIFINGTMSFITRWRPVAQAAMTSGTLMACGDLLSQSIRQRNRGKEGRIDYRQTANFAIVGLTLHGPYFYAAFSWLDRTFPSRTISQAAIKTITGQLSVFPVYVVAFFTYIGLLEGKSLPQCVEKLHQSVPRTLVNGSIFWPIVNMFNFLYVPSTARVAYINAAGLIWNAYLSWQNSRINQIVLVPAR